MLNILCTPKIYNYKIIRLFTGHQKIVSIRCDIQVVRLTRTLQMDGFCHC